MNVLKFPDKEFETIQALMIQALDTDCRCVSCKGLMILAKRIKEYNENEQFSETVGMENEK